MTTVKERGLSIPQPSSTQVICMRMPSMSTVKTVSSIKEELREMSKQASKKPRRTVIKGKWAGMTATYIAQLMGCSTWTAKQWLYKFKPVNAEEVGLIVYKYRSEKDRRAIGGLLDWGGM